MNTSQGHSSAVADAPNAAPGHHQSRLLQSLMTGAGALGLALVIERGGGFLANVLAARLGGAGVFGAYSIALAAANNVAWYVGAGIGDTASRFTARYAPGTREYRKTVHCLLIIAGVSAAIAAALLLAGARPMAKLLLRNEKLTGPLQVAAFSSVAFIFLECCRGLYIGTRSFGRLLVLSTMVGIGLLAGVPQAAKSGASLMLSRQSGAVLVAVAIAAILILRRQPAADTTARKAANEPHIGQIWRFGLMQLGSVIGMNAAGWWTASLVARWDTSLLQVAFYTVATQLRNVSSLVPSMVQHGNFAFFTDEGSRDYGGPEHVVAVSCFTSSVLAVASSGFVVCALPWILHHFYGRDYVGAELPGVLAISTLLVHFGLAPAASRLLIMSPLWAGVVNGIWAVMVVGLATWLIPYGGATAATATLFAAHLVSMFLVVVCLWRFKGLPKHMLSLAAFVSVIAGATVAAGWLRTMHTGWTVWLDLTVVAMSLSAAVGLFKFGETNGIFPRRMRSALMQRIGLGCGSVLAVEAGTGLES